MDGKEVAVVRVNGVNVNNHGYVVCFFFFNDTATTEIYTLSLHDALPILPESEAGVARVAVSSVSICNTIR